ncbi:MAG: HDIG domain-containing protein [Flavobacteriales bacterium]|nr:HDIG domain-containing protein [Flavobacteriales bacterium]
MKKKFDNIFKYNNSIYRIIVLIVAIVLVTYWMPKGGQFNYEYQQGKPWLFDDLFAPFDFAISKSDAELRKEVNDVKADSKLYFVFDEDVKNNVIDSFNNKIERIGEERAFEKAYLVRMRLFGAEQLQIIYKLGILAKDENLKVADKKRKVTLLRNNIAEDISFENFYTISTALQYIDQKIYFSEFVRDKSFLDEMFIGVLQQNVKYDSNKTLKGLEEDVKKVSLTRGFVARNTRIISKGDIVEGEAFDKLNSLKYEYESKVLGESDYIWITAGHVIKVAVLLVMMMLFLFQFKKDVFDDTNKVTFIYLNILLMIGLASFVIHYNPKFIYIVPISIVPIVLKSFFDSRLGLITHIFVVLLIGFMAPNPFEFTFIQITAGIVTVLSVSSDHRRASIFISVGQITLIYFLTYFAYSISQKGNLEDIDYMVFLYFAINGLLTLFAQPLIYMYEKSFKLVSDVSLLELSDTNSELLKLLSDKAPGTFQHSLMVANIAESAAHEIGANARLVRTGALYHDIGKMNNPLFFIENQQTHVNPHDELAPKESASIIISHVLDGVDIAKKYNIPDRIIDFIRTHHGESMVYYFYKQYEETSNEVLLSDKSFRYPGPIPYSKETAILMMADALEAASRSLKVYDSKSIGGLVDKIISKQMEEGQFLNSNITLREIETVKRVITKKLLNIYHARIEYPD